MLNEGNLRYLMKSPVTPPGHNNVSPLVKEANCALRGGHVLFVGAGPGQPDLLTVRAIRALEQADVVVHDQLVSPAVLNIIRPNAQKILLSEILESSSGKRYWIYAWNIPRRMCRRGAHRRPSEGR